MGVREEKREGKGKRKGERKVVRKKQEVRERQAFSKVTYRGFSSADF